MVVMIEKKFTAINKRIAVKKATDFWYDNYKDDCRLMDFLAMCRWKKIDEESVVVTYRGPAPK